MRNEEASSAATTPSNSRDTHSDDEQVNTHKPKRGHHPTNPPTVMTISLQTLLALATILLSSVIHSFTTPYTSSLIRPPLSSSSQQAPSTCSSRKTTVPSKSGLCMSSETEVEDIVATVEVEDEGKILVCFSSFDECTSYVRCVVVGRIQKEVYNDL